MDNNVNLYKGLAGTLINKLVSPGGIFSYGSLELLNLHLEKSAVKPGFSSMVTPQKWFQEPFALLFDYLISIQCFLHTWFIIYYSHASP